MRWLIGALAVVALVCGGFAGVRIALRHLRIDDVQRATGVVWPEGSELLDYSDDEGLRASHTTITVRVPEEHRQTFLLAYPALTTTGCTEDSATAFGSHRSPAGLACLERNTASADFHESWRVMFDVKTGELVEQVDSFY